MAWFLTRRENIKQTAKRITAGITATALASTSVMVLAPAQVARAIDNGPTTATVTKAVGGSIANNDLLSGTVADVDGIQIVRVRIVRASDGSPLTPNFIADVADGTWSQQLSKSSIIANPDITSPSVRVELTITDQLANQTEFNFGPFNYVVPGTELFAATVAQIASLDPEVCAVTKALQENSRVTVFGPNNEALQAIPAAELAALLADPQELCAVLATHILAGRVESSDITTPVEVTPENPNNQPLTVEPKDGSVVVNNESTVVNADNTINRDSLLHVINAIIRPRSTVVDIDAIHTNLTSPALQGTVADPAYNVTVRINGQSYNATNNGNGTWSIPAGVVTLDPKAVGTLFSVVAKYSGPVTSTNPSGIYLAGISLRNDVLHYVEGGMGSGGGQTSSTSTVATFASAISRFADRINTGEVAATTGGTSSTSETKAPEPTPVDSKSENNPAETVAKANNQWYWWIIGIATLGALYYILGGNSAPATTSKKK